MYDCEPMRLSRLTSGALEATPSTAFRDCAIRARHVPVATLKHDRLVRASPSNPSRIPGDRLRRRALSALPASPNGNLDGAIRLPIRRRKLHPVRPSTSR